MTGASGGGTQTMILAAIDPRVKLAFPAVMVSTAMQGGCTCENASLLRVDTGNVEFAGLFAPKPHGMTTANDWTKEMSDERLSRAARSSTRSLGAPNNVMLPRGEQFPHNYNAVSRSAFYTWLNRHFKLGFQEPSSNETTSRSQREQLTVWDDEHPAPKADGSRLRAQAAALVRRRRRETSCARSAESPERFASVVGRAVEVLIGRTLATAGDGEWQLKEKHDRGGYVEMTGLLRNKTYDEALPVVWLYPKKWNGRVVVWLDDAGKSALYDADGSLRPAVAASS